MVILFPRAKLTKDDVIRDVRNSEIFAHREELIEATGGAVLVGARRWVGR